MLDVELLAERLFLKPNFAPIFFHVLPSLWVGCELGLVPGEVSTKATWEVGGVLGGVIGSMPDAEGDSESVLSSVKPSGDSADEVPGEGLR